MRQYIIALVWGFAEATFFFFIPDIYLTRVAITNRKKAILSCFIAAVGACLGGIVMFAWGAYNSHQAFNFLTWIPAIFPKLIMTVQATIQPQPFKALFVAPFKGIPYKIYAVELGSIKVDLWKFIVVSFFARLTRFLLITGIGSVLVILCKKYLQNKTLVYMHIFIWWLIYCLYFYRQVMTNF